MIEIVPSFICMIPTAMMYCVTSCINNTNFISRKIPMDDIHKLFSSSTVTCGLENKRMIELNEPEAFL